MLARRSEAWRKLRDQLIKLAHRVTPTAIIKAQRPELQVRWFGIHQELHNPTGIKRRVWASRAAKAMVASKSSRSRSS